MVNGKYTETDFMNQDTGKVTIVRAAGSVFQNSKCIFVEYYDIIRCPWFILLFYLRENKDMYEYFDFSSLRSLTPEQMYLFYINRDDVNPIFSFPLNSKINPSDGYAIADKILYNASESFEELYEDLSLLNFYSHLSLLLAHEKLVERCVFYTEDDNPIVRKLIKEEFPSTEYVNGNLDEILEGIPQDSTYVFSDITKVNNLVKTNKINYSSIIVPADYAYNFNNDKTPKVDIDTLHRSHQFKFNYFNNTHEIEHEDDEIGYIDK